MPLGHERRERGMIHSPVLKSLLECIEEVANEDGDAATEILLEAALHAVLYVNDGVAE
jgi:hypothetical protein